MYMILWYICFPETTNNVYATGNLPYLVIESYIAFRHLYFNMYCNLMVLATVIKQYYSTYYSANGTEMDLIEERKTVYVYVHLQTV